MSQKIRPRHPTICRTNKNEYSRSSATAGAVYLPQANTEGGAAGYNRGRAPRHGSGAKFAPSPNAAKNKAPSSDGALFFAAFGDWICTYRRSRKQLNSFVSANVAQIKRLQVVNFVVFCVVLADFLKNPCHNTIFSNMKIKDCSRHRIIPAPAPGMAAQQSAHSEIKSLERPMLSESLKSILRTSRSESAGGRLEWRDA